MRIGTDSAQIVRASTALNWPDTPGPSFERRCSGLHRRLVRVWFCSSVELFGTRCLVDSVGIGRGRKQAATLLAASSALGETGIASSEAHPVGEKVGRSPAARTPVRTPKG